MFGLNIFKEAYDNNLEVGDVLSSAGDKHGAAEEVITVKATQVVAWMDWVVVKAMVVEGVVVAVKGLWRGCEW